MYWRFVAAAPVQAQIKALEPVKIGYSGIGIAHDLMKIMEKNRIFEKYGLNSQAIYIGSGSLMNQAIVGGSIQFTTSDLPSQIQAALAGIDFKIISVTINRLDGAIMARKEIRKPEELKGKRLAISRFGSVSDIVTQLVLRYWKLEPQKDVAILQVGNTPSRIAAIFSGQVDGGLINPTDIGRVAASGCCMQLADLGDLDIPYARFGVTAMGRFLEIDAGHSAQVDGSVRRRHPLLQNSLAMRRWLRLYGARRRAEVWLREVYQKVADSYRSRPDPECRAASRACWILCRKKKRRRTAPESLIDPVRGKLLPRAA